MMNSATGPGTILSGIYRDCGNSLVFISGAILDSSILYFKKPMEFLNTCQT